MTNNPLQIKRFGPITFYVKNAAQEAKRLSTLFGMQILYIPKGEEPIYGLQADDVIFILDGSKKGSALAFEYGNHISEIGIRVEDTKAALAKISAKTEQPSGTCKVTGVTFVEAPHDGGLRFTFHEEDHLPHAGVKKDLSIQRDSNKPSFNRIDHIVTNTQKIQPVIKFMSDVFGMQKVNEFTVKVETDDFVASLYSEVMGLYGMDHPVLFPVNEPLAGDDTSQIPAQLREMKRSHAQHVALSTSDILHSIEALRAGGMGFLEFRNIEHANRYYGEVPTRLGTIPVNEAIDKLQALGILVDKCGKGYLLQLFSQRIFQDRSVPFLEIIQRESDVIGCFGDGNFAALAEALEYSMRETRA